MKRDDCGPTTFPAVYLNLVSTDNKYTVKKKIGTKFSNKSKTTTTKQTGSRHIKHLINKSEKTKYLSDFFFMNPKSSASCMFKEVL